MCAIKAPSGPPAKPAFYSGSSHSRGYSYNSIRAERRGHTKRLQQWSANDKICRLKTVAVFFCSNVV
jgi:hypothetical protein